MMNGNFVQVRRGIIEHLETGQLSAREFAVYNLIILLADKATGLWWGCSKAISAKFGHGDLDDRAAKGALHRLEENGYIRRFFVQGQRGNHPILVDKYAPTVGELKGRRVNAAATADWRYVVCDNGPDDVPDRIPEAGLDKKPETGREHVPLSIPQDLKPQEPKTSNCKLVRERVSELEPIMPADSLSTKDDNLKNLDQLSFAGFNPMKAEEVLAYQFFELLGCPKEQLHSVEHWCKRFHSLVQEYSCTALDGILQFALTKNAFWTERICNASKPMDFFEKSVSSIHKQYMARERALEAAENQHQQFKKRR